MRGQLCGNLESELLSNRIHPASGMWLESGSSRNVPAVAGSVPCRGNGLTRAHSIGDYGEGRPMDLTSILGWVIICGVACLLASPLVPGTRPGLVRDNL